MNFETIKQRMKSLAIRTEQVHKSYMSYASKMGTSEYSALELRALMTSWTEHKNRFEKLKSALEILENEFGEDGNVER